MGKASRKKRLRAEATESPTVTAALTPPPPPRAVPMTRWALPGAVLGTLIGALVAYGPAGDVTHGGLIRLGLSLGLLAAGLALVHLGQIWRGRATSPWATLGSVGAGVLSLMALLARHPEVHLSPLSSFHAHFVGVPVELAFAALAAGALAVLADTGRRTAWWLFAGGGLWCAAALGMPHHWLGDVATPVSKAARAVFAEGREGAAAGVVLGLTLPVAAWLVGVSLAVKRRPQGRAWTALPRWVLVLASAGVAMVALDHVGAGLWASGEPLQWSMGVAIAALLVLVTWMGATAAETLDCVQLSTRSLRWGDAGLVLTGLGLYGALKIHGMGASNTDENIYFYMAEALSRGQWPYLDYFFAHPPLHVLVPGGVMAITGFGFTLAKSFSVVAGAVTGFAVWSIGREHLGRLAGLTALGAFLFAAETLKATTNMTGINLTTMWLMLGVWQSLRGRGLTAGVLFGLAACTGFYSMAAICAVLTLGALRVSDERETRLDRWSGGRGFAVGQLVAFLGVAGAINALFFAVAGDAYLDGVYRYHGLKAVREAGMLPLFGGDTNPLSALFTNLGVMVDAKPFNRDVYYHSHLWLAGLVAPLVGLAAWSTSSTAAANPLRFVDPRRLWRDGEHGIIAMIWLIALAL
ncbi:MAG: glycosyltransferase family 39 protein, partial [Myxococcota bacterium]|nr:glycosyltransferase family 39 protein [Myxococcota bacterium]